MAESLGALTSVSNSLKDTKVLEKILYVKL